jgi:hypothetical protein
MPRILLLTSICLVACGGEPVSDAVVPTPSNSSATAPSPTATPTPTTTPCGAAGGTADPLTGFGASFAAWTAHHQADPQRPDFFLPALNDGLDRYTFVLCTQNGRVVAYHLNFTPLITLSEAKRAYRSELPWDAVLVYDTVNSGCEHIQYRSPALARAFGADDPDGVADAAIILPANPEAQAAVETIFIDTKVRLNVIPAAC